jgi:hypothetical protein
LRRAPSPFSCKIFINKDLALDLDCGAPQNPENKGAEVHKSLKILIAKDLAVDLARHR